MPEYHGTFTDNILVVGQMGCEKTTFIQILAIIKLLENLKVLTLSPKLLFQRIEKKRLDPASSIRRLSFITLTTC